MTRFIVLAHERTGSTLLVSCLRQHPEIRVYFEIFNSSLEKRLKHAGTPRPYIDGDVAEYLSREIFCGDDPHVEACGFKLFYNHARWSAAALEVWPLLACDREVRVVHLLRENLLAVLVSILIAQRTKVWHGHGEEEVRSSNTVSLAIPPSQALSFFKMLERQREEATRLFSGHPMIVLDYISIASDPLAATNAACRFLGLAPLASVHVETLPLNHRPLSACIANFGELEAFFSVTPYARFFL